MSEDKRFSNTSPAQCKRLLKALIDFGPTGVTSYYANTELGIYHPPARIKQLRDQGHKIVTEWQTIESDSCQPRRVARYALISLAQGEQVA